MANIKNKIDKERFIGFKDYERLYKDILTGFNNDLDKMYKEFLKLSEYMDCFGDTKEKALKNYCRFKSENVIKRFSV